MSSEIRLATASRPEIRAEFENLVLNDLLGPANGPDEELNEAWVSSRYLVGWLAPRDVGRNTKAAQARIAVRNPDAEALPDDNPLSPVSDDTPLGAGTDEGGEEGIADDPISSSESMLPNSLGLTFCLAPGVDRIRVRVSWGWYRRRKSETGIVGKKGDPKMVWYRTPIEKDAVLELKVGDLEPWSPLEDAPEVTVRGQVREEGDEGKMVTLFLVNDQDGKDGKDDRWLFQVCLGAESVDGGPDFVRHSMDDQETNVGDLERIENDQMRMSYRHRVEFAVGHGASVEWRKTASPMRASAVWTTPVPTYEVAKAKPQGIPGLDLRMAELAACPQEGIREALLPMATAYSDWIDREVQKRADPNQHLDEFGEALEWTEMRARTAVRRIEAGIDLLARDAVAHQAFVFMNEAMHQQRLHGLYSQRIRRGDAVKLADVEAEDAPTWFPFQLAFVLLNLPSLTDLTHPERCEALDPGATAELLWFPTGGGKTEAYLGLTAYTLAIRRSGRGRGPQRDGGRGGHHALHPAPAHPPAVPARHHPDLRLRDDKARRSRDVGRDPVPHRPLGGPVEHAEHLRPSRQGH